MHIPFMYTRKANRKFNYLCTNNILIISYSKTPFQAKVFNNIAVNKINNNKGTGQVNQLVSVIVIVKV